jgi:lysozyme family protein
MADFKKAYDITMGNEGFYDNDPSDVGGETYKGIARNYDSSWEGWLIIDDFKHKPNFPKCIDVNILEKSVQKFYKMKYWDVFLGDKVTNQDIANELFDTSVNMGGKDAVTFLQMSLNALNRNQKLYSDLVEDGSMGSISLNALALLPKEDIIVLLKMMNVLQGMHYMNYMRKSPIQEKYARGWFSRVSISKDSK